MRQMLLNFPGWALNAILVSCRDTITPPFIVNSHLTVGKDAQTIRVYSHSSGHFTVSTNSCSFLLFVN